ncbi:MAG TPA: TraR/DksA C4-type zinc finger protein [Chitinophagaceae bacterium]|nr:TraR/DksA C4-type zinc finger protein [Chitinophagaceae bacterium]
MASKKKKVSKPKAKKSVKPAKKAASRKKAAKKPMKKMTKKPVSKSVKASAKKPVHKAAKPAAKVIAKPLPKLVKPIAKPVPVAKPELKPLPKKGGPVDPKSLVSIKQKVKPVIKKEPPRATKFVIPKTTIKSSVKYEPEFTKSVLDNPMYMHTGPSMRYSDADLAEFREIIQKKLDAAKKELNYLQGLITRKDEGGDMDEARYMTMEDGSVSMEREQLSQMASRQITFIDHLEKAMMRIENKTYGICRVTGKLIDKARLRAVPHATLSIEAKQMMNK